MLILEKIEKAAKLYPADVAFKSRSGEIIYAELWEQSDKLASYIRKRVDGNKPIIVFGHKEPKMMVAFLACVKSGHAYCPVDPSMPVERISDICDKIGNANVIAVEDFPEGTSATQIISKDEIEEAACNEEVISDEYRLGADDVYYIIFTSGSTGKPKGVQITQNNLSKFTDWSVGLFGERGIYMNQAPYSFDLSVLDTYTGLSQGSTILSLDKELTENVAEMLGFLAKGKINYFVSTPSFANMLLADKSFSGELIPTMRKFVFCGEKLPKETARKLMERFPNAKVVNTYGPTESTVAVSGIEITREMLEEESLPIGVAKPGTEIKVDGDELVIIGDTVSPGYFEDEEKTAKVFGNLKDGRRYYRSGDSGFYKDGVLYYKGRLDFQIKLHGYRIELGDIENNLAMIEGIADASVLPKYNGETIRSLTAFVVKEGNSLDKVCNGEREQGKYIKEKLKEKLPHYMIPKKVTFIDEMPMTNNGKKDRKRLEKLL